MIKINISEYFLETVSRFPDKIAVKEGNETITFSDLYKRANKIAQSILGNCDKVNQPIGVFLPKSINAVAADMGVTLSGNAYMNMDVKNPEERLFNILSVIRPAAIITTSQFSTILEKIKGFETRLILIDNIDVKIKEVETISWKKLIDTDPYCIINTSGSTGTPKGVVLNHKSFIDFMEQTFDEYGFNENDSIGSLSPTVFDIWSFELCVMLAKGSQIVIIPDTFSAFPMKILNLLNENKVSFIFWVPTIMVNIANMGLLDSVTLPDLRLVWFAGEVFPTKQFNVWYQKLSHTKFANFYGPIEITLDCVYYNITEPIPDDKPIPIGKPFRNTSILILDEDNKEITEEGKDGELCVRGSSLAMGYYNNPTKTSAAFVQNPLNTSYPEIIYRTGDVVCYDSSGNMVFKGRRDTLIKHLGYRIELGEIEHIIINTLKIIENGCVVYNKGKKEITVFYESPEEISPSLFRKEISKIVPKYMVPTVYIHEVEMKRNTNGKIDRLYYNNFVNL